MIVTKPCMNEFIAHLLNDSYYIQTKMKKIIDMNRNEDFELLKISEDAEDIQIFNFFWSIWKMKYDMKYVLTQDKILYPIVHSQAI